MRTKLQYFAYLSLASMLIMSWSIPVYADPPSWAPAHGYRAKHKGHKEERRERHRAERRTEPVATEPFGIDLGHCNREQLGQVLGGVAGAAAGSTVRGDDRPVAIVAGTILGVLIGGYIGKQMDKIDQYCVGQTLEYAHSGQTVTWNNPDTGAHYTVTPKTPIKTSTDQYCREYQTTVTISGKQEKAYGRSCRQPDGSWKKVE